MCLIGSINGSMKFRTTEQSRMPTIVPTATPRRSRKHEIIIANDPTLRFSVKKFSAAAKYREISMTSLVSKICRAIHMPTSGQTDINAAVNIQTKEVEM